MLPQLNTVDLKIKAHREMHACVIGLQIVEEGNFGKSPEELLEIIRSHCNGDEALVQTTLTLLIACTS